MEGILVKWKLLKILGYDNYSISEHGEIFNYRNNHRTFGADHCGYKRVTLTNYSGKTKQILVHVLVAKMFLVSPDVDQNLSVDHIDRNKANNHYSNLRWSTRSEQRINQDRAATRSNYNKPITLILDDGTEYITYFQSRHAGIIHGISPSNFNTVSRNGGKLAGFRWKFCLDSIDGEIWKQYPDLNSEHVLISNFGRYYKKTSGKIGYGSTTNAGYKNLSLNIGGVRKSMQMHVLVMNTFIGLPPEEDNIVINHIDHNKRNNKLLNLEYVTQLENSLKAISHGARTYKSGSEHHNARKIAQYHKNGILINIYNSLVEAANASGATSANISTVCHGNRKYAMGFIWKFHDERV